MNFNLSLPCVGSNSFDNCALTTFLKNSPKVLNYSPKVVNY